MITAVMIPRAYGEVVWLCEVDDTGRQAALGCISGKPTRVDIIGDQFLLTICHDGHPSACVWVARIQKGDE